MRTIYVEADNEIIEKILNDCRKMLGNGVNAVELDVPAPKYEN